MSTDWDGLTRIMIIRADPRSIWNGTRMSTDWDGLTRIMIIRADLRSI
ncbi:MAG: hypothetical protein KatS3mg058_3344 [Roseiflexus sp.]|nr:MAG: hypothetical protein KatS3mg058_3344 [Roseiflexus sp.]